MDTCKNVKSLSKLHILVLMDFHLLIFVFLAEAIPNRYGELLDHQLQLFAVHVVVDFYFEL